MAYDLYQSSKLNKETLTKNNSFVSDARLMLTQRENYDLKDLETPEQVYDQFMEHFRYQNVNEVTALLDLEHVQKLDETGKKRFGRLMNTYDRMDSDLGLNAAQDYLGGVLTAPSTYAGAFSFGAGKAASQAGLQGVKWGIRQAIKSGGLRSAAGSMAVEGAGAGATVYAQESTRVESKMKDEVDLTQVGLATGVSTLTGGLLGLGLGTRKAMTSNVGGRLSRISTLRDNKGIQLAHKTATQETFKNASTKTTAGTIADVLIRRAEEIATEKAAKTGKKARKASLRETVGEQIKEGEEVLKNKGMGWDMTATMDVMTIQNISAAAARIDELIPKDIPNLPKGTLERLTSRFTRGLSFVPDEDLTKILRDHNVTKRQLMSVYPTIVSEAGRVLQAQSAIGSKLGKASKDAVKRVATQLDELDQLLIRQGINAVEQTAPVRRELDDIVDKNAFQRLHSTWVDVNKARIGFMTMQTTTTIRNTSNGYLRNFNYALDNLGTGLVYLGKGSFKSAMNPTDEMAKAEAKRAVRTGVAMIKGNFASAVLQKDLVLGLESNSTNALFTYMRNQPELEQTITRALLRDLGDVAGITGDEGGILKAARTVNFFNTMSDNMFKRAVFSREIDKALRIKPLVITKKVNMTRPDGVRITEVKDTYDTLDKVVSSGNIGSIDDKVFADAMKEALEFTYQTSDFSQRKGYFNKGASAFINIASTSFGGMFAPFPRYMVNQFRFAYEHSPLMGLINLGGIKNKVPPKILAKNPDNITDPIEKMEYNNALKDFKYIDNDKILGVDFSEEAIGKQISGLGMIGTFMALRYNFGDSTTGPYEYINPITGDKVDARASIGPFSMYAWAADLMYRYNVGGFRGEDAPVYEGDKFTARPILEALVGQQGRAGTGLDMIDTTVNLFIDNFDDEEDFVDFEAGAAKFIGSYLNTYTVGAGTLKDILGTVDERYRRLPDNADVDFLDYVFNQAVRSIPIPYTEEDKLLPSTYKSSPVERNNPILKLVTGLTPLESQNFVKDEMDRLRLDYFNVVPKRIRMDPELNSEAKALMGKFVERELASFINSPDYTGSLNDEQKKSKLKTQINILRTTARNAVMDPNRYGHLPTTSSEVQHLLKIGYFNKSKAERKLLKANYASLNEGADLEEDEEWGFQVK